jgi:hypothetical protein
MDKILEQVATDLLSPLVSLRWQNEKNHTTPLLLAESMKTNTAQIDLAIMYVESFLSAYSIDYRSEYQTILPLNIDAVMVDVCTRAESLLLSTNTTISYKARSRVSGLVVSNPEGLTRIVLSLCVLLSKNSVFQQNQLVVKVKRVKNRLVLRLMMDSVSQVSLSALQSAIAGVCIESRMLDKLGTSYSSSLVYACSVLSRSLSVKISQTKQGTLRGFALELPKSTQLAML